MPRVVTVVVGAGPAGLLFSVLARLLHERRGGAPSEWPIYLFDKRDTYERTHRLRIAPEPFPEIARDLADPRFDALVAFLADEGYRPTVNALEARLSELARTLGVTKELVHVGDGEGMVSLPALRRRLELEGEGRLLPDDLLTVIAADSVHSELRERVRGREAPVERTHQVVARLRMVGEHLPATLGVVEQYKLSKVLASILDYRANPNGFGELDLFLTAPEHSALTSLGATPREPVALTDARLQGLRAPFFREIVAKVRERFGECELLLSSTFRLEHRYIRRVVFEDPEARARVFLVGDAAISLPFFRGMASLTRCAYALAKALAEGRDPADSATRYQREVEAIRRRELEVVGARAWLVRGAREFVRVSALLPFPLQTWLLSFPDRGEIPDRASLGLLVNLALAGASTLAALGGLALAESDARFLWVWSLAVPLQLFGGAAYAGTRAYEGGPHRYLRAVWRVQIAGLFVGGVCLAAMSDASARRALAGLSWFVLALPFITGLYVFEALDRRGWKRSAIDE